MGSITISIYLKNYELFSRSTKVVLVHGVLFINSIFIFYHIILK